MSAALSWALRHPFACFRITLGVATAAKAVLLIGLLPHVWMAPIRMPYSGPAGVFASLPSQLGPVLVTVLFGAAVLVAVGRALPHAPAVASAAAVVILLSDQQLYSNHLWLQALLLGLLAAATRPGAQPDPWALLLIRTQISVVYAFAAVSKRTARFLSGDVVLTQLQPWVAALVADVGAGWMTAVALAAVLAEAGLAIALWLPRWRALAASAGVALHVSFVVVLVPPLELVVFGLLMCGTYPLFLGQQRARARGSAPRTRPTAVAACS